MENVALDTIQFNNDNSILFSFSDTVGGNWHKQMLCKNVWKFCESNIFDESDMFPYFICDVFAAKLNKFEIKAAFDYIRYGFDTIPASSEYTLVCMDSGEVCIKLICKTVSYFE